MNVTLCSAFRNSRSYIDLYFAQIGALHDRLKARGDTLHFIFGEGDSVDDTWSYLSALIDAYKLPVTVCAVDHGGPEYGSVVSAERFEQLAGVWSIIWQRIPQDADAVIFCESDLIWSSDTMLALLDDLEHVPCVAPMVMMENGWFWDTWAFIRKGRNFGNPPPFHPGLEADSDLVELDSAGSLLVMRGDIARRVHWPAADVVKGVCRQIIEGSDSVWLNTKQKVMHP